MTATGIVGVLTRSAQVSLLQHWKATFARFAPDMSVHIHHSNGTNDAATAAADADVIITTSGMLLQDRSAPLRQRKLWRVIIDEAHLVSNPKTAVFQALAALRCTHVWCITGTPIQNSCGDLRALMRMCGVPWAQLPRKEALGAAAEAGCSEEAVLRMISKQLLLRRLKEDVFKFSLPPEKQVVESIKAEQEHELASISNSSNKNSSCSLAPPPPKCIHSVRVTLSPAEKKMQVHPNINTDIVFCLMLLRKVRSRRKAVAAASQGWRAEERWGYAEGSAEAQDYMRLRCDG
jgi:superfamily II DNA or RNA helicase